MTDEAIRAFTSAARITVTYAFDNSDFDGRIRRTAFINRTVRDAYPSYRPNYRPRDDGLGFFGGFVMGSMFS